MEARVVDYKTQEISPPVFVLGSQVIVFLSLAMGLCIVL